MLVQSPLQFDSPPRYLIAGKWYCNYSDMLECAAPELFPIDPLGIQEMSESDFTGLGHSIYSPEQFNLFQEMAGDRDVFLAVQTGTAYKGMNAAGDWGLPSGGYKLEQLIDIIQLYQCL